MNRRGQGLSVNVIILVALGLIVLIIAIILVNRSGRNLSENAANTCISKGGYCTTQFSCDDTVNDEQLPASEDFCPKTKEGATQYCCRYNFGG